MIRCEVVFDVDSITVNDKTIYLTGGFDGCICCSVDNTGFLSLKQAIKYCMEQSK